MLSRRLFCTCHSGQGGGGCAGSGHPEPHFSTGPSHPATGMFDEERRAGLERGGAESGEPYEGGERSERDAGWISTGVYRKSHTQLVSHRCSVYCPNIIHIKYLCILKII